MFLFEWVRDIQNLFRLGVENLERRSFVFAVFMSAWRGFNEDNCMHLAAGVAYYAVMSIFPLILGLIALSSLLLQSAEAQDTVIAGITGLLPGTGEMVRRNIDLVLRERGTIGVIATIILLWSATWVFAGITTSLNLAWNVKETRPFLRLTAMQLGLVLVVGFFLLVSFALTLLLQLLARLAIPVLGVHPFGADIWSLLAGLLPLSLTILAFFLVYRFVPNTRVASDDVWPGAITAGVLFVILENGFVFYTSNFANFRLVYGSIGAIIALLFWAWVSAVILLFGAEICAAYSTLRRAR